MALDTRTRFGPYEVIGRLGAGGMGEVYRVTDTKLGRDVAIKTLPAALASDEDRLARFEREAKLLAALNHAHIASVYSLDEHDGTRYLAMELVEGETLEETLKRGALPIEDALRLALQIAEALEAAHAKGVVHRDLKPANVMVTPDGVVKVLDFGLAKGFSGDPNEASPAHSPALSMAMTQQGLILGTAGYMSPEQASGQATDQRADIWAFGVVLYEMLTGLPLFSGESVPHVLADVLRTEPDWTKLPKRLHPRIRQTLERCLEKKPRNRYHSIADARVDIEKVLSDPQGVTPSTDAPAAKPRPIAARIAAAIGFIAVGGVLVAAANLWLDGRSEPASVLLPAADVVRFTVPVGEGLADGSAVYLGGVRDARDGRPSSTSLALAHNGRLVAYSGWRTAPDGSVESRLYLRRLDRERAEPIDGTDDASTPFFSPDDAWVGFFAGASLKRVSPSGGNVETVAIDARLPDAGPRGATWGDDGTIIFAGQDGLYRVAASGGNPERIASPDTQRGRFRWYAQPHLLPGSRALLFHGIAQNLDPARAEIFALDRVTGGQTTLLTDAMNPRYVAATRQLVFARQGTLMAVGFDADRLALEGEPVVVIEDVMQAIGMPNGGWETGAAQVAISPAGHLAYASGGLYPELPAVIMRVPVGGDPVPLGSDAGRFGNIRVSPAGDRLVFMERQGRAGSIHLRDLDRGVTRRLNTGGFNTGYPAWSPDGAFIAFSSDREDGVLNVYRLAADGSGEPERLTVSDENEIVSSWSSQGVIAYLQTKGEIGNYDIWVIPPDAEPTPFFVSDANERWASFSPDGRWLAYVSDETGEAEVYVRPYPGPGAATLISGNGGGAPAWSRDGRQIYYLEEHEDERTTARTTRMMVVDVVPGTPFGVGRARPLIDPWIYRRTTPIRRFDILPDGAFVSALEQLDSDSGDEPVSRRERFGVGELHVILSFVEELRRRAGE